MQDNDKQLAIADWESNVKQTFFYSVFYRNRSAARATIKAGLIALPMYTSYEFDVWLEKASRLLNKLNLNKNKSYWRSALPYERSTKEYHNWRIDCLNRDDWICQGADCQAKKELQVHHIKPYKEHTALRIEVSNGITLCKKCHKDTHKGLRHG